MRRHPVACDDDRIRPSSKWRRQLTLGPYTVDFACIAAKLVVEIDSKQRAEVLHYDAARTRESEVQRFTEPRFTNTEVRERSTTSFAQITETLRDAGS